MINKCISQGSFPDCLKIAQVISVYKKGSKTNCSNYRPISLYLLYQKSLKKLSLLDYITILKKNNSYLTVSLDFDQIILPP